MAVTTVGWRCHGVERGGLKQTGTLGPDVDRGLWRQGMKATSIRPLQKEIVFDAINDDQR